MTCQELMRKINSKIETDAEFEGSEIQITKIYEKENSCVARLICPIEGKLRVMEIEVKKLADWDGIQITSLEHLVP